MSNPVRLTDDELSAVMLACQPLAPEARDGLLQAVAASLQTCGEVGPGSVHRAIVVA
jgi:predicted DNA-binding transcriptional regulator YafY